MLGKNSGLTVEFPKELTGRNFARFAVLSVFILLSFEGYCELEGAVQTAWSHGQRCPLSHKGWPRVAQSRRTYGVDGRR